jgi:hypothetical protein
MKIKLELDLIGDIQASIDALQRAVEGKPQSLDFIPMLGIRGILIKIQEKIAEEKNEQKDKY